MAGSDAQLQDQEDQEHLTVIAAQVLKVLGGIANIESLEKGKHGPKAGDARIIGLIYCGRPISISINVTP